MMKPRSVGNIIVKTPKTDEPFCTAHIGKLEPSRCPQGPIMSVVRRQHGCCEMRDLIYLV